MRLSITLIVLLYFQQGFAKNAGPGNFLWQCFSVKPEIKWKHSSPENVGDKVLFVILHNTGIVKIGRDTVEVDKISRYVQERLFKSYLGTGKMHDRILFAKEKGMEDSLTVEIVVKEIKEGQSRALRQICTEKYKKLYDELDEGAQKKIRKQFPILFQTDFLSKPEE
jgi:hypothetical protein